MSQSRNLAKSRKKLSKSGNSTYFDTIGVEPKFLTPDARITFNRLWLAFIKAPILWYFDPEYYIQIETNALNYTIHEMLSQLNSGTNPDGVITKTNLGQWHLIAFISKKNDFCRNLIQDSW